jgi:hypothetical protein
MFQAVVCKIEPIIYRRMSASIFLLKFYYLLLFFIIPFVVLFRREYLLTTLESFMSPYFYRLMFSM